MLEYSRQQIILEKSIPIRNTIYYFDEHPQSASHVLCTCVIFKVSPLALLTLVFLLIYPQELYIFIQPLILYYNCHFLYDPTALSLHFVR